MKNESIKTDRDEVLNGLSSMIEQAFEEVLDIDGLSAFIHLDRPTIYSLTSTRRIPHTKPTGKLLFIKSDIIAWLRDNRVKTLEEIAADVHDNRKKT